MGKNFEFRDLRKTSLGAYLKEISKIPLLTRQEEQDLGKITYACKKIEKKLLQLEAQSRAVTEKLEGQLTVLKPEYHRALEIKSRDRLSPAKAGELEAVISRYESAEKRLLQVPKRRKSTEKRLGSKHNRMKPKCQVAIQKMVEANLRFVVSVANRFSGCGIPLIDLINEGNIGLIEAAKRFNPGEGVKFISYAVWWIRQAIMQVLAEQSGSVRLPLKQAGLLYKIRGKYEELSKKFNREPTSQDLSQALDIPVKEIEDVLRVSRRALSLESPVGEGSDTAYLELMPAHDTPAVDQQLIVNSLHEEIMKLLEHLSDREREIITLRFGIGHDAPMTLEGVGVKMGLSRERIRQIEKKAKKKLQRTAKGRNLMDFLN